MKRIRRYTKTGRPEPFGPTALAIMRNYSSHVGNPAQYPSSVPSSGQ